MNETYTEDDRQVRIELWGDTYAIRADWRDAASPIQWLTDADADEWGPTQYQVADFGHDKEDAAIAIILEGECEAGNVDDDDRAGIEAEIRNAVLNR